MKLIVTGAAGFIGFHLCKSLLAQGYKVHGIDNINHYYDPALKHGRLLELGITHPESGLNLKGVDNFTFHFLDLMEGEILMALFAKERPDIVVHLAAQAGVRHSITEPQSFIASNIQGFFNVLEAVRKYPVKHLLYASSSSVYGSNSEIPFRENAHTHQPVSLYGATKKAGEVIAHAYVELYKIPSTGLRFFTVYGPWGRPDMAYYKFADHISQGKIIDVYNNGQMQRDFTYVDDIVEGIISLIDLPPVQTLDVPHRILNIGRSSPVNLLAFIEILEENIGGKADKNYLPMQIGEIETTYADTTALKELTGYSPSTDLAEGIRKFATWYKSYHGIA